MVSKTHAVSDLRNSPDEKPAPVASMVEDIVGCKWSVQLLRLVADGCHRPSELLRACPGLTTKVMNERLRKMTRFGILRRTVFGDKPPIEVDYWLTGFGGRFLRILDEVRRLQEAVDSGAIVETGETSMNSKPAGRLRPVASRKRR